MKTQSTREFQVYEVSEQELRIHWDITENSREESDGSTSTYWEAREVVCNTYDNRSTIIEAIISSEYSTGRELSTINNKEDSPEEYLNYQAFRVKAKALADGWLSQKNT